MISKKTSKNQITLPKAIADRFPDAVYFDVTTEDGHLTVTQDVTADGSGTVDLRTGLALGEQSVDVAVNGATVSSGSGAIQVYSCHH